MALMTLVGSTRAIFDAGTNAHSCAIDGRVFRFELSRFATLRLRA